ncbi:MAG: DUF6273 domain-containing protein [Defluviitaleaceae bacterium]|nr:DUF6273 domain-containing protein [Defluviitaleaceae bacterium]
MNESKRLEELEIAFKRQSAELDELRTKHKKFYLRHHQLEERVKILENVVGKMLPTADDAPQPTPDVKLAMPDADNILEFGGIYWQILMQTQNGVLVLANDILEKIPYHDALDDGMRLQNGLSWEKSTLRDYLNNEFIKRFDLIERSKIILTRNSTKDSEDTDDNIFLLSIEEARTLFKHNKNRIAKFDDAASWWWLRTPGRDTNRAAIVFGDGHIFNRGSPTGSKDGGLRPAMWLKSFNQ